MDFYKHYAIIENGVVIEYPVNPRTFVLSTGDYNIPPFWEGGILDGKTYVFCHDKKPQTDYTEILVETTPYYDNEMQLWYRGYQKQTATDELIALRRNIEIETSQSNINALLETYSETQEINLELSNRQKEAWDKYRNELLEIPNQIGYPMQILWPTTPDSDTTVMKLEVTRI